VCISGYPVSMKRHQLLLLMYSLMWRYYEQLVSDNFRNFFNAISHIISMCSLLLLSKRTEVLIFREFASLVGSK
jgi:hypothetical protein